MAQSFSLKILIVCQIGGRRESRKESFNGSERIKNPYDFRSIIVFAHIPWLEILRIFPNIAQIYMWVKKPFFRCIIPNGYFVLKNIFDYLMTLNATCCIVCRFFFSISMKNRTLNIQPNFCMNFLEKVPNRLPH